MGHAVRLADVTFERAARSEGSAVVWTGQMVTLPHGDLFGTWQTAWIRSVLEAAFGPADESLEDGAKTPSSWSYELVARVRDVETRLDIRACHHPVVVSVGLAGARRFQASREDPAVVQALTDALMQLCETWARADFSGRYASARDGGALRYGVLRGVPWVDKKAELHDCHPRPGSLWAHADASKGSVVVALEGAAEAQHAAGAAPSDAEIEAYYAAHVPPSSPPLAVLREHIMAAILASRKAPPPLREVRSRAIADVVDDLGNLARFDFVPLSYAYHAGSSQPIPARRGAAKLERLAKLVRDVLANEAPEPAASPLSKTSPVREHAELWRAAADDLEAAAQMLAGAAPDATFTVGRGPRF
ncbi:hypothetical protein A7982_13600 [Minicystis rosea]|nr:hypothetical protein A7982_13600 [Minicystis rosea]